MHAETARMFYVFQKKYFSWEDIDSKNGICMNLRQVVAKRIDLKIRHEEIGFASMHLHMAGFESLRQYRTKADAKTICGLCCYREFPEGASNAMMRFTVIFMKCMPHHSESVIRKSANFFASVQGRVTEQHLVNTQQSQPIPPPGHILRRLRNETLEILCEKKLQKLAMEDFFFFLNFQSVYFKFIQIWSSRFVPSLLRVCFPLQAQCAS